MRISRTKRARRRVARPKQEATTIRNCYKKPPKAPKDGDGNGANGGEPSEGNTLRQQPRTTPKQEVLR